MKTAVVILNWNTKDYLRQFLPPLLQSVEGHDAAVIVADSASTDGSMDMMAQDFPAVRTIALEQNYGFTGGYNRALAQVEAEYFVLINSDIEVTPDWLTPLESWMDSHPECGVCGPKLLSWHRRETFEYAGAAGGLIDSWGFPFCRGRMMGSVEKDCGQYDSPAPMLWVSGACLMTRSCVWRALEGLDARFFAHMEEIDYCWRCQLEGYSVWSVPASAVYHIGGGTLPSGSPLKLKLNYRNNLLMLDGCLPRTFVSDGLSPERALRKTRKAICRRRFLDGCCAGVYAVTFKWSSVRAVAQAHKEYKRLRSAQPTVGELRRWADNHRLTKVAGRYRGSMILASVLHRKIKL